MKEIDIKSLPRWTCLLNCCFQTGKIKVFQKNNIIIITDGFNKKYGRIINNYFEFHRDDGPAMEIKNYFHSSVFRLNNLHISRFHFANETKHLICNSCNNFCNQRCFI